MPWKPAYSLFGTRHQHAHKLLPCVVTENLRIFPGSNENSVLGYEKHRLKSLWAAIYDVLERLSCCGPRGRTGFYRKRVCARITGNFRASIIRAGPSLLAIWKWVLSHSEIASDNPCYQHLSGNPILRVVAESPRRPGISLQAKGLEAIEGLRIMGWHIHR